MTARSAFTSIVAAAFLSCCAACLVTADAVSGERRHGTLMLLLLTRVNHLDILLAKVASNGLPSFAALVAFIPVMMLPLVAGGTSAAEGARMALALANALFVALMAGLCASAFSARRLRAAYAALGLTTVLVLAPLVADPPLRLASPLSGLICSRNAEYQLAPSWYWLSLVMVQGLAWILLAVAVARMRRAGDKVLFLHHSSNTANSGNASEPLQSSSRAPLHVECRYCGRMNVAQRVRCYECGTELHRHPVHVTSTWTLASAPSPMHWLLARQQGLQFLLWVAAGITALRFGLLSVGGRFMTSPRLAVVLAFQWGVDLLARAVAAALIAYVASRFVIEARRTGELEPLLTTPAGASELVSAQWDTLKRIITLPLLMMLAPVLIQGLIVVGFGYARDVSVGLAYGTVFALSAAQTVAGVAALCWLGLLLGLCGLRQGQAILWTVLIAAALPRGLMIIWEVGWRFLMVQVFGASSAGPSIPLLLGAGVPQALMLGFYLYVINWARCQLRLRPWLRGERFELRRLVDNAIAGVKTACARARQWPGI